MLIHNPTRTATFTFRSAFTAYANGKLDKASAKKVFIFNYSYYIADNLLYTRLFIVTLFIFDDMIKNVQIAVSSLPQLTVRKPPFL
jgi:hypothetical protein